MRISGINAAESRTTAGVLLSSADYPSGRNTQPIARLQDRFARELVPAQQVCKIDAELERDAEQRVAIADDVGGNFCRYW